MASEAKTEEPTMEEILASIRRIISEDEQPAEGEAPAEEAKAEEPEAEAVEEAPVALEDPVVEEAEPEEDVLELTDIVPDEEEDLGQDAVDSLFDEEEDVVLVERQDEEPEEVFEESVEDEEPETAGLSSRATSMPEPLRTIPSRASRSTFASSRSRGSLDVAARAGTSSPPGCLGCIW